MNAAVKELREMYGKETFFFDEVYDDAVEGMDMIRQSIIYNQYGMINITMKQNAEDFDGDLDAAEGSDEWNDFYDSFIDPVYEMFTEENTYTKGKFGGKIPPTLLEPIN